ncbi:hypothetical protein ILYODFUR_034088 [Ilyodon furcidens]|uniref:Uncharacterized protein n=1 Tax=Ilyodon furcidens TaxID=33524 RepID=A0ABV0VJI1_9TELE
MKSKEHRLERKLWRGPKHCNDVIQHLTEYSSIHHLKMKRAWYNCNMAMRLHGEDHGNSVRAAKIHSSGGREFVDRTTIICAIYTSGFYVADRKGKLSLKGRVLPNRPDIYYL